MVETQFKVTFPGWANWKVYKVAGRQQPYTVLKDGVVEFFSASKATVLNRIEADHVAVCPGCRVRWTAFRSGPGENRDSAGRGRQMVGTVSANSLLNAGLSGSAPKPADRIPGSCVI